MANLTKNQVNDFQLWFKPEGDTDFSPEHNKQIVEDSIKAYECKREQVFKRFGDQMMERSEAVAYLLRAIDTGKDTSALKYFGKAELARLRGEQIVGEMRLSLASMQRHSHAEKKH